MRAQSPCVATSRSPPGISTPLQEGEEGASGHSAPAADPGWVRRVRQAAAGVSSQAGPGRSGAIGTWGGWLSGGLVPAAAGVGARLARGEVLGSHAGSVLQGDKGRGQVVSGHWAQPGRASMGCAGAPRGGMGQDHVAAQLTEPWEKGLWEGPAGPGLGLLSPGRDWGQ